MLVKGLYVAVTESNMTQACWKMLGCLLESKRDLSHQGGQKVMNLPSAVLSKFDRAPASARIFITYRF